MAEVKWIKITTDIFDDEKILLIESMPDAYAIITVWFKLLCLAGKQNNSGVFLLNDTIVYTDKMLATIFRMKETTVTLALQTFEQFGMVKIVDGVITIPNWGKHQNLDSIESKRNYQREYMRNYRERQAQLVGGKANSNTNSKANVSRAEIEEEKEDRYNNIYTQIVAYLNAKIGANYRDKTPKTQSLIRARLKEGFTLDDFKTVIDKKTAEWTGTEWEKFLRPETLFSTKFESYLNSKTTPRQAETVYNGYSDEDLNALDDLY